MSIHYQSRVIGEVRATHINGEPGLGAAQLRFVLAWTLAPKRDEVFTIFGTSIWISASAEGETAFTMLGQAVPERAWCEESRGGEPFDRHVMYRLNLAHAQVLALENSRQARGVVFKLDVHGNTHGPDGLRTFDEHSLMPVNVSDWVRVLREASVADVLLVGVHVPIGGADYARAAIDLVRRANEHLAFGHYTAAVAECRRAIESLWKSANLKQEAGDARKRLANMNGQLSMSKRHRELALGEALRIYCHVAHHVGDDAEPEVFGRLDAALAVSTAAALVSSLVKDPDLAMPATPPASAAASEIVAEAQSAHGAKIQDGTSLASQVVKVREHLTNNPRNRPSTMKKLRSVLDSLFGKRLGIEALDRLVEELERRKIVVTAAGKLAYSDSKE
jgi:hypothetical protein